MRNVISLKNLVRGLVCKGSPMENQRGGLVQQQTVKPGVQSERHKLHMHTRNGARI